MSHRIAVHADDRTHDAIVEIVQEVEQSAGIRPAIAAIALSLLKDGIVARRVRGKCVAHTPKVSV